MRERKKYSKRDAGFSKGGAREHMQSWDGEISENISIGHAYIYIYLCNVNFKGLFSNFPILGIFLEIISKRSKRSRGRS